MNEIKIWEFENDQSLWIWIKLAISVKSTDLNAKLFDRSLRKIKWKIKRKLHCIFWSDEKHIMIDRDPHSGLIKASEIDETNEIKENWKEVITAESHSCDFCDDLMIIANMDHILIFNSTSWITKKIYYPWLMNIHSVVVNNTKDKILVTSSSFDTIFEIDINSWEITWEWCAWENWYNESPLWHVVTRNKDESANLENNNIKHVFISDPNQYKEKGKRWLPTKFRALSINWAEYFDENTIWFTWLNYSKWYLLDKETGKVSSTIGWLKFPHSFKKVWNKYLVCSTENWEVVFFDEGLELSAKYSLEWIPVDVKASILVNFFRKKINMFMLKPNWEWLEYCEYLGNWLYWLLDSKRSVLILVNFYEQTYRKIGLPSSWALSQIKVIDSHWYETLLKKPHLS